MGLGHIRRNLLIARMLAAPPIEATVLLIAGVREAGAFMIPAGVDLLTLPAYLKNPDGEYCARSLDISTDALRAIRADTIRAALRRFDPRLLIVDNVPRGALDELMPALRYLADRGSARCILGMRDVLDEPAVVRAEWLRRGNFDTVRAFYDAVWIYGDPTLYDTLSEYDFADDLREKSSYTGYLDAGVSIGHRSGEASDRASANPRVLCVEGGGQDGFGVASIFARAEFPKGLQGLIVTGPFMPAAERRQLARCAAARKSLDVMEFVFDPLPLLHRARAVVSMGGYNAINEILSLGKPVLVVPRTEPRREQMIRAERLRELGLIDCIPREKLSPTAISDWLRRPRRRSRAREVLDFNGLGRVRDQIVELTGLGCSRSGLPIIQQAGPVVAAQ